MARAKQILQWRNLGGSLWLSGGKESQAGGPLTITTPAGNLRRSQGVHPIRATSAKVRTGSTSLNSNVTFQNSIIRFANFTYYADILGNFYQSGILNTTLVKSGLTHNVQLTFAKMPPQVNNPDYLFVAGGGTLFKVDQLGNATNWGIQPPSDGIQATINPQLSLTIASLDGDAANWTLANAGSGNANNDSTFKVTGGSSLRLFDAATVRTTMSATRNGTLGLTNGLAAFSTLGDSTDADIITFYIASDQPSGILNVQMDFDLGTSFTSDFFSYTQQVNVTKFRPPSHKKQVQGLASVFGGQDLLMFPRVSNPTGQGVPPPPVLGGPAFTKPNLGAIPHLGSLSDPATTSAVFKRINEPDLPSSSNLFTKIKIAKSQFTRIGTNASLGWANVTNVRFLISTTTPPGTTGMNVWLDSITMIGGQPLQGTYGYLETFFNSTTGSRSNPNKTAAYAYNVERASVLLSNLNQSTDTQANRIEIWRTVGNGGYFFKIDDIPAGTTSYTDIVADYFGMAPVLNEWLPSTGTPAGYWITPSVNNPGGFTYVSLGSGTTGATEPNPWNQSIGGTQSDGTVGGGGWKNMGVFKVMQDLLIQFDNTPPASNFNRVAGPWNGSLFWCTGLDGKLYYSPPGRPEAYAAWLDITSGDDKLQMPIVYNGNLYVFSQQRAFIILAVQTQSAIPGLTPNQNLYTYQTLDGIPGTTYPFTIAVTDLGLIYLTKSSGFVLFNGSTAPSISDGPLGQLPYGVTLENYPVFNTANLLVSAWGMIHEYMFSDGKQVFAYNTATGSWRACAVSHANNDGGFTGIYYAPDLQQWIAGNATGLISPENGATSDTTGPIPFEIEPPSQEPEGGTDFVAQRIYIEANLGNPGQTLTPFLVVDGVYYALPAITGDGSGTRQRFEIPSNISGRLFSINLAGNVSAPIEVFWMEMDVV